MGIQFELQLAEKWMPVKPGDTIQGKILSLSAVPWKDSSFPILTVEDDDGCPWTINCGCYCLSKVWENPLIQPGGYLAVVYRGESKTIESCGNHAKMYGVAYFKPGDWQYDETGSVAGKQTSLGVIREVRPVAEIVERSSAGTWRDHEMDESPLPFDPEIPEHIEGQVRKTKKK